MSRGRSLQTLLNDLRVEIRASLNPASNTNVRESQVAMIQKVQRDLWEDFDWPHLKVDRYIDVAAGQRYYSLPADITIDRIIKMEVRFGGQWLPLMPGIEAPQYAAYDSDLLQRGWPVERWALSENEQIELWPIPDSNYDATTLEGRIKVEAIKNLSVFVDDDDTCDIDGRLIVLFAAAHMKAASGAKDADMTMRRANVLYQRLRGHLVTRRSYRMFGGKDTPGRPLRGPPTVYYRTSG